MNMNKKITRDRLKRFLSANSSQGKTLDVGCGDSYYRQFFPNRVSVDLDPRRSPDIVADIHRLPFSDEEFDVILCTEVLEHVKNPFLAVSEMKRVLKKGGKILLTTRFIFPIHDAPVDFFRYTSFGLAELFKDWEIKLIQPETGSLEAVAVILQRLIFQVKFVGNIFIKAILFILQKFFMLLQRCVQREFGDIKQTNCYSGVISSGYYLVAYKK